MIRRLPILPTLIVLAAVAVMVRLGFWQLARMDQKEALLAQYSAAQASAAEVPFAEGEAALYHRSRIDCAHVTATSSTSGRNASDEPGLAITAECLLAGGKSVHVVLGWSRAPVIPAYTGGEVRGVIAPGPRLVADPPLAGLTANARPDPANIANNHLSYAAQWFLFAATALVIYALALRKRLRGA